MRRCLENGGSRFIPPSAGEGDSACQEVTAELVKAGRGRGTINRKDLTSPRFDPLCLISTPFFATRCRFARCDARLDGLDEFVLIHFLSPQ